MISKTFTYENFNGDKVTETCWFHLSRPEITNMVMAGDGLKDKLELITSTKDSYTILKTLQDIILKSYGEKTSDGRSFIKNEESTKRFEGSIPYEMLYTDMFEHPEKASDFIKGILPKDFAKIEAEAEAEIRKNTDRPIGIE